MLTNLTKHRLFRAILFLSLYAGLLFISVQSTKINPKISAQSQTLTTGNYGNMPITKDKELELTDYAESLSDYHLIISDPNGKIISDTITQKSVTREDSRIVTLEGPDGVYILTAQSTDAAGNQSPIATYQIELDTTPPTAPQVGEISICGDNLCTNVAGEDGAWLYTDSRFLTRLDTTTKQLIVLHNWSYSTKYTFNFYLLDRAQNKSSVVTKTITTPAPAIGDGGVLGEQTDLYSGKTLEDLDHTANMEVFIDKDNNSTITKFDLPAPILTTITNNYDDKLIKVYGVAPDGGFSLNTSIKVTKEYMSYDDALKACGGILATTSCMKEKTGLSSLEVFSREYCFVFGCNKTHTETQHLDQEVSLNHVEVLVDAQNQDITKFRDCGIGAQCFDKSNRYWNGAEDGKFTFGFTRDKLKANEIVSTKYRVFTDFQIEAFDNTYSLTTTPEGRESQKSNEMAVPEREDFFAQVVHPLAYDTGCAGFDKTDVFGNYQSWRTQPHTGVDLAKDGGCLVNSVSKGKVTVQGWDTTGGGYIVRINHNTEWNTLYLHAKKDSTQVSYGQIVNKGQYIFYMGNTTNPGISMGIHLHITLNHSTKGNVDPEKTSYFGELGPTGTLYNSTKQY